MAGKTGSARVKNDIPPLLMRLGPLTLDQLGVELGGPHERTLRRQRAAQPKTAALMPVWLYPGAAAIPAGGTRRTVLLAGWQAPISGFAASMKGDPLPYGEP
jgi:hypothetical protein